MGPVTVEKGRPDVGPVLPSSLQTLNDGTALGKDVFRGFFSQYLKEKTEGHR